MPPVAPVQLEGQPVVMSSHRFPAILMHFSTRYRFMKVKINIFQYAI